MRLGKPPKPLIPDGGDIRTETISVQQPTEEAPGGEKKKTGRIAHNAADFEKDLKAMFHGSTDLILCAFDTVRGKAAIAYIDGMIDKNCVDRDIVAPLKAYDFDGNPERAVHTAYKTMENMESVVGEIINGNLVLWFGGQIVSVDLKGWEKRSVEVPQSESVTRGPVEGFIEDIRTNTVLIRRKVRNANLVVESMTIGRQTNTLVEIIYIDNIVNKDVLTELKTRLSRIDADSILETGYIEQFIQDSWYSPTSGMGLTLKPDVVAGKILEGRVAILCDGTPHALTIPELFIEKIFTAEDYYNRSLLATSLRILRIFSLFIAVMLPGVAVAVMTYSQEMIPPNFIATIMAATQKTPLSAGMEAFFLIVMFELIRESGTRLPKPVGGAISIVGSLIIGDAAINAGIVGAPMVIIIGLTALASFVVPSLTGFITFYRLIFLLLGSMMGLLGIGTGMLIMYTHVASAESFGIPILSQRRTFELQDSIWRSPWKFNKKRPPSIQKDNIKRQRP